MSSAWMQAEDIHVANLLQWGDPTHSHYALQYALGTKQASQSGTWVVAGGQENPRVHILGHTIILGAASLINFPDSYLAYRPFWEEARRQGAIAGYAHGARSWEPRGWKKAPPFGLAIDLPGELLT